MTKKAATPIMMANPTIPAMTPPTMAPTLVLEPPDEAGATEVAEEEAEVDEGLMALDSGAPESATNCAAVALKLSGVTTSKYAQDGMEVPAGMGLGYL